jgi:spore coat polysaccharide biosynthesis protein SpsF
MYKFRLYDTFRIKIMQSMERRGAEVLKVIAIIQARMNSTRLPGKILKKVLNKPLLEHQIDRIRRSRHIQEIVIATTTNDVDECILDVCRELGLAYYRGSEHDVLSRYEGAAAAFGAEVIVRLTSDCPVIDPDTIDRVVAYYLQHHTQVDYVSNFLNRTYPRGMDTEVFSASALHTAHLEATQPHEREHVTPFLYANPNRFRLSSIQHPCNESHHRWTVDTPEDLDLITQIIEALYPTNPNFSLDDILTLMRQRPELQEINAFISQKT